MRVLAIAVCLAGLGAAPAAAQVAMVDEGSFAITRQGARVGREAFRIRRTPTGAAAHYVASATVVLADRELAPDLRTDTQGAPLAYQLDVRRGGGPPAERFRGAVERGLFTAVLSTSRGESSREYMVGEAAVVLDDDVYHQYYFIALQARPGTMAVLVPRRGAQLPMRVEDRGRQPLAMGGRSISARHLVLSEAGGATRDVWLDADGRVLRVAVSSTGLVAEREQIPE